MKEGTVLLTLLEKKGGLIKECYEQLHFSEFNNLDTIDQVLERQIISADSSYTQVRMAIIKKKKR